VERLIPGGRRWYTSGAIVDAILAQMVQVEPEPVARVPHYVAGRITDSLTIHPSHERAVVPVVAKPVAKKRSRPPRKPPGNSKKLNEFQAAEEIGYAVTTLRTWRSRGKGPPWEKIEGGVRYDRDELRLYQAKARRDPSSVRAKAKETKRDRKTR
jgi:hypothetical protein